MFSFSRINFIFATLGLLFESATVFILDPETFSKTFLGQVS
jgi:hypothetical protein